MTSGTKAAALAALAGSAATFSGLAPAGLKPAGAKLGNARLALRNARPAKTSPKMFETSVFKKETIEFSKAPDPTKEDILRGGRDKFPLVKDALQGVKKIGVIGWGSQAPAQAQNFKDTLAEIGSDITVTLGDPREHVAAHGLHLQPAPDVRLL